MNARPCSLLVPHRYVERPRDNQEAETGYHAGCLACQERDVEVPRPSVPDTTNHQEAPR